MEINLKAIFATFKTLPGVLKVLAAIVAFDGLLVAGVNLALSDTLDTRLSTVDQLKAEQGDLRRQIAATHNQLNQIPALRLRYNAATAEGLLAPKDRNRLSNSAKDMAVQYHLTSFSGRFEPEKFDPIKGTDLAIGTIRVEFAAGAMIDSDVDSFWSDLLAHLPAHYRVLQASEQRAPVKIDKNTLDAIRNGRINSLVDAKLVFQWLSLGPASAAVASAGAPTQ